MPTQGEVKIQVTTQAQTQGLKQAETALKDTAKAAQTLDVNKKTLVKTLEKLKNDIPGLSFAINALKNPYFLLAAAISTALSAFKKFYDEVEARAARAQGFANLTEQFGGFRDVAMQAKLRAEEFADSLKRLETAAAGSQEQFKTYTDTLQKMQDMELQIVDAQTALEVAQIRSSEKLSPEQKAVAVGRAQMRGESRREDVRGQRAMDKQLVQEAELWQAREDALTAQDELSAAQKNLEEVTKRQATLMESANQTLEDMPERRRAASERVRKAQDRVNALSGANLQVPGVMPLAVAADAELAAALGDQQALAGQASGARAALVQGRGMIGRAEGRLTRAEGALTGAEGRRVGILGQQEREAFQFRATGAYDTALGNLRMAGIQQESDAGAASARASAAQAAAAAMDQFTQALMKYVGAAAPATQALDTATEKLNRLSSRQGTDPYE
jgi:hypothetical protein